MRALIFLTILMFYACTPEKEVTKEYYDDGSLKEIFVSKNDLKDGPYRRFYPSGNIEINAFYKDDQLVGMYVEYFETGYVKAVLNVNNGMQDGDYVYFDEGGSITQAGRMKNNKYIGLNHLYRDARLTNSRQFLPGIGSKGNQEYDWDYSGNIVFNGSQYFSIEILNKEGEFLRGSVTDESDLSILIQLTTFTHGDKGYFSGKLICGVFNEGLKGQGDVSYSDTILLDKNGRFLVDYNYENFDGKEFRGKIVNSYSIDGEMLSDTIFVSKAFSFSSNEYKINSDFCPGCDEKPYNFPDSLFYPSLYSKNPPTGMQVEYYDNTNIKSIRNIQNGVENGNFVFFDEYGNLQEIGQKEGGYKTGIHHFYDKGVLTLSKQYLPIGEKIITNQIFFWDKQGNNLIGDYSRYFIGHFDSDDVQPDINTFKLNSKATFVLALVMFKAGDSKANSNKFIVGDFNEDFYLLPDGKVDTLLMNKKEKFVEYSVCFSNEGKNVLRGKLINRFKVENKSYSDTIFFLKEYFVEE